MNIQEFLKYLREKRKYSELTVKSYATDLSQFEYFLIKGDKDKTILDDDKLISINTIRSWIMTLTEQGITTRYHNKKYQIEKYQY